MKISEVKFFPVNKKNSKVKAFASVTLDKTLCITGIRVIEGSKGLFISFPNQKGKDDEYYDVVFPVTKEAREGFSKKILDAYKKQDQSSEDEDVPFS